MDQTIDSRSLQKAVTSGVRRLGYKFGHDPTGTIIFLSYSQKFCEEGSPYPTFNSNHFLMAATQYWDQALEMLGAQSKFHIIDSGVMIDTNPSHSGVDLVTHTLCIAVDDKLTFRGGDYSPDVWEERHNYTQLARLNQARPRVVEHA